MSELGPRNSYIYIYIHMCMCMCSFDVFIWLVFISSGIFEIIYQVWKTF